MQYCNPSCHFQQDTNGPGFRQFTSQTVDRQASRVSQGSESGSMECHVRSLRASGECRRSGVRTALFNNLKNMFF
jgi:hypothetical protein